jgi:hypothetical protein
VTRRIAIDLVGAGVRATLAVLGGETRGIRQHSASVMIYRKGASGWVQEARLEPRPLDKMNSLGEVRSWLYAKAVDVDDAGQSGVALLR